MNLTPASSQHALARVVPLLANIGSGLVTHHSSHVTRASGTLTVTAHYPANHTATAKTVVAF